MELTVGIVHSGIGFGRNFLGILFHPYETYRKIVNQSNWREYVYISGVVSLYFLTASLVKTQAFRPFLLTRQFIYLFSGAIFLFLAVTVSIFIASRLLGSKGSYVRLAAGWAYTLIPTVFWFWTTSILYVLLPPPRTVRPEGILFSVVYLLFSALLLYWKVTLGYLAIRFATKMSIGRIIVSIVIASPVIVTSSVFLYVTRIMKVPFL